MDIKTYISVIAICLFSACIKTPDLFVTQAENGVIRIKSGKLPEGSSKCIAYATIYNAVDLGSKRKIANPIWSIIKSSQNACATEIFYPNIPTGYRVITATKKTLTPGSYYAVDLKIDVFAMSAFFRAKDK